VLCTSGSSTTFRSEMERNSKDYIKEVKSMPSTAWRDEGQGLTEYALLIVGVALFLIVVLVLFGDELVVVYQSIIGQLPFSS
jgi:Flp pilus assembly pilin Flp